MNCLNKSKIIFSFAILVVLGSSSACSKRTKNDSGPGTTSFITTSDDTKDTKNQNEYLVEMQSQNFQEDPPPIDGPSPMAKAPSELAKSVKTIKIEYNPIEPQQKILTMKAEKKSVVFNFESTFEEKTSESNLVVVEDTFGSYQLKIICKDALCERARFRITEKDTENYFSAQYIRSTEYFKMEDLKYFAVSGKNDELLREAIEYGFPIARHTVRLDSTIDRDLLVIERPLVSEEDEGASLELQSNGSLLTPTTSPSPSPTFTKTTGINPNGSSKIPMQDIVPMKNRFNLTKNPIEAYQVDLPDQLFQSGAVISSPNSLNANFRIIPIRQQAEFEPSYRIKVIAEAMVNQRVRIYRNACNIFVRAVMALAGYLNGPWPLANNFETLFLTRSEGLSQWEKRTVTSKTYLGQIAVSADKTLKYLPENHSVILQIKRAGKNGHVGIISKENGQYYFYDASLDERKRGTVKKSVDIDDFIRSLMGNGRIISYPKLIPQVSNTGSVQS